MSCEDMRHDLGVYVLGALTEEEEARVREHLARCDACRDEHARLAGLRPLLDLAEPGDGDRAIEQPSPLLEDAVLAGFAEERGGGTPRRRRLALPSLRVALPSAALGAAVAVVALAAAGALNGDDDGPASRSVELSGAAGSATAVLAGGEPGTIIELDAKLPPSRKLGDHYEVWMTSGDYRITAGSFRVGPDGHVHVELACGGPPDAYDGIEVVREDSAVLRAAL